LLGQGEKLSLKRKCELLGLNRNTAYYRLTKSKTKTRQAKDIEIKEQIEQIQLGFPYYGYRNITHEMKRKGQPHNHKAIQRIMRKHGLKSQIIKLFKSYTNSKHKLPKYPNLIKELTITEPNCVWGADITYIRLTHGFVYLAAIIDFYTKKIRGWELSKHLDASLTIKALNKALAFNPEPKIHHSDQGVQYCDYGYTQILKDREIQISMSDKGNPCQNNITESFFKTLKYNEVYLNEYESFEEAQSNIENFIEIVYHKKRLHSSLGYLPPEEFEQQYLKLAQQSQFLKITPENQLVECPRSSSQEPR
jgi:transposase InsO family protein